MDFFGLLSINDWLLFFCFLVFATYKYTSWHFDWWTKQGVPGPKPKPFGMHSFTQLSEGLSYDKKILQEFGDNVGIFEGRLPGLFTTDDDILREVLVKQFHNFTNRRFFDAPARSGFDRGLFFLTEEKGWKDVRHLLSPVFSSGRLKKMTKQVNECALHTVKTIGDLPQSGKIFNLKTIFADMTIKFIATVAFGLDLGDEENIREFSVMGRKAQDQVNSNWRLAIVFFAPKLAKFLQDNMNFEIIDLSTTRFFTKVIESVLESRKTGRTSLDLIQVMANAHNETVDQETIEENKKMGENIKVAGQNIRLERDDILANGVLFFIAGYDTVSTSLSFLFYELAAHQDIQQKAFKEVSELFKEKNELNFDDVQDLKFLDRCYCETLRLHPVISRIEREAKNDITINGMKIMKGTLVNIPIAALHHDPKRWTNPEEYKPERFTEEEKKGRSPFSWMPFGYGPRHCIGMRLALLEAKLAAAHIIYNFKFEPCATTQIPYKPHKFGLVTGDGLDINILPRKAA